MDTNVGGLLDIVFYTVTEFARLERDQFTVSLSSAPVVAILLAGGAYSVGRLIDVRFRPSVGQRGYAGLVILVTILLLLLWFSVAYLKPAVRALIQVWQEQFIGDTAWNQETFEKIYWEVRGPRAPDGGSLESFDGFPPPEGGGNRVPLNAAESRAAWAALQTARVAEHFHLRYGVLELILGVDEQPWPERLKQDIDSFFLDSPSGSVYPHERGVEIAGKHMLEILQKYLPRIVFWIRLIVTSVLAILWLPLYAWIGHKAWTNLNPVTV